MLVVSNTSPLSNLAIIGQLDLIREQLGEVLIPSAVHSELAQNPQPAARAVLEAAISQNWIRVTTLAGAVPVRIAGGLHSGEAETLALALERQASLVLLDESAARLRAKEHGLTVTGVLGILRLAKKTGRIRSLKEQMTRLRGEARFFISPALEKALLISVGED